MPSLHLAEAHTGRFLYELAWPAPGMGGQLGACHGLDVPMVFGNLTEGQLAMLLADTSRVPDSSAQCGMPGHHSRPLGIPVGRGTTVTKGAPGCSRRTGCRPVPEQRRAKSGTTPFSRHCRCSSQNESITSTRKRRARGQRFRTIVVSTRPTLRQGNPGALERDSERVWPAASTEARRKARW